MSSTEFVYTTYIKTTPERLWQALTEPAFTKRYWGLTFETDWKAGSAMVWNENGEKAVDPGQIVLEADPYNRLAYTWHTFSPAWAKANGVAEDVLAKLVAEPRSKASFDLEPIGETVKLTVTHDGIEPGTAVVRMVSQGWPHLLAELKTLLETGDTMAKSG